MSWKKIRDKADKALINIDAKKIKESFSEVRAKVKELAPKNLDDAYDLSKDLLEEGGNIAIKALNNKPLHEKVLTTVNDGISNLSSNAVKLSGTIGVFLADVELLKQLEKLTKSAATEYDKALDRDYLATKIGGGNHRMFDGGHDIFNAWERAKEALPDDTFSEEVIGYVSALWKDVSTTKGLPFATVSKDTYDSWAQKVSESIPGVDKKYFYDLLSFDAFELLSTGLGAVSIVFALKKEDQEKLAEILGSMGIISILSANPIMGIFVIATSAFAYNKKKMEFDQKSFSKSAIVTTSSMALFSALGIFGLPLLMELILVGVLTKLLRKQVLDNTDLHNLVLSEVKKFGKQATDIKVEDVLEKLNQFKKVS